MFVSWTSIELSARDSGSQQRVNLCLKMHFILIWVCFNRFNLGSAPHDNSKLAQISKLAQHDLNMRCFYDAHAIKFLDLTDKIFKNKITLFILLCGKELLRCKKIYAAVDKDGITKSALLAWCVGCQRGLRKSCMGQWLAEFIISQKGFGKLWEPLFVDCCDWYDGSLRRWIHQACNFIGQK